MDGTSKHIIALVLCLRAFPDIASGQIRDGILGHGWGSSVATLAGPLALREARAEGNLLLYSAETHTLGDARVEECQLEFINGHLAGVIVTTVGKDNSDRLLHMLRKEYGEGHVRNARGRTWLTPETHVSYDMDTLGDAYAYWYSTHMQK